MDNRYNEAINTNENIAMNEKKLKKYTSPILMKMGAMQKYTLGGSIGTGDSGSNSANEAPRSGWGG